MARSSLRILALEPYYAGSHAAFLDGWSTASGHDWTLLTLPGHHWKWRMRHAGATFAEQVDSLLEPSRAPDAVVCSDMLNLAEFRGLAPAALRDVPAVAYFHENQLTYPNRQQDQRDLHFALSNVMTALSAEAVWFNSRFHRDSFISAVEELARAMPDNALVGAAERIGQNASVQHPAIDWPGKPPARTPGPLRIGWAARWEHDKNPATFFAAADALAEQGDEFELIVIGEQFRDSPDEFEQARRRHEGRILRWGYQPTRQDYQGALAEMDVIVSSADHEFFGLSVCEAVAAGAYPLLPNRLAYPELLEPLDVATRGRFFYDGSAEALAERLAELSALLAGSDQMLRDESARARGAIRRFSWDDRIGPLDAALADLAR